MSKKEEQPGLYRMRVEILGMTPVISRELMVESKLTMFDFHEVLQVAFGWTSMHAHRFVWADPAMGELAGTTGGVCASGEKATLLHEVAEAQSTFLYEYVAAGDTGDGYRWRHQVSVMDSEPGALLLGGAVAIGGTMNGPPEHCNGPAHYKQLLTDFADGSVRKRNAAATQLFRHGLFNPIYYDERGINLELRRLGCGA